MNRAFHSAERIVSCQSHSLCPDAGKQPNVSSDTYDYYAARHDQIRVLAEKLWFLVASA